MAFKDCLSSTGCKQLRVLYSSVMGFAMFVVGIQNQDLCNNGGAYYLEVMGGLTLGILILMGMFRCCCDPDILRFIHAAGIIASLITYLWGSVAVFGAYGEWTYADDDSDKENYCPYTPFMFSYVMLVLNWCVLSIAFVCACFDTCLEEALGDDIYTI